MGGKKLVRKIKDAISRGSRSPSPEPGPSSLAANHVLAPGQSSLAAEHVTEPEPAGPTTFLEFLHNELKEDYHKLVATSFAMYIRDDSNARLIDLDDVFHFLGYKQKVKAVELLLKIYPNAEPISADEDKFSRSGKNRAGRKKISYLVSFDQFEELLLAAQTPEGVVARKAVLAVKKAVFKFIKLERAQAQQKLEDQIVRARKEVEEQIAKLALAEREKASLATQLKNLREAKSYLYAFWLFDDRYKCGITDNPEKREKQHRTSCPSGRMVHTVIIACKQSEKLLDSILKKHGNHVRQEEYEIEGGNAVVRIILDTIARVEESLHTIPFDQYNTILEAINRLLDGAELTVDTVAAAHPSHSQTSLIGQIVEPVTLHNIDRWLVHMIEEQTLPGNPMTASDLLFKYNSWLGKFAPDLRPIQSKNFLRPQLRSYFGHGIQYDTSPGRAAYYQFDLSTLLDTLVRAHKIAAPASFLPDD